MDTAATHTNIIPPDTSNILFRKLFYESKDMIILYDFATEKCVDVNAATLRYTGYSREEFLLLRRSDLTPQFSNLYPGVDLHSKFLKVHAEKVIRGEAITESGIFCQKDGTEHGAEFDITPTERKTGEAFIKITDVTKNLSKKTKYIDSEIDFKSIVESTSAGITIVDLNGVHIYVSPQIENLIGYTAEEMLGTSTKKYFKPSELEKIKHYSRKLLKGEPVAKSTILQSKHKNGTSVWVQGTGVLLKDEHDKPTAIQTIFIDTSNHKLLEKEILKTKTKYQQIIENLQGVFMLVDLKGHIEYVSPNYTTILGYESSEVIGKKGLFVFCKEAEQEIREHSIKLLNGEGESYTSTYKAFHKDGTELWVNGTFSLVKDTDGNPEGFASVYLDQTAKLQTEKELEKTKSKYQHIIENLNGVVSITDLDGINTYVSPLIINILGYTSEELIGKSGLDIFFESEHKVLIGQAQTLISDTSHKIQQTYKGKHKDGSIRWINSTASVIKNKHSEATGFVTIFFDVTEELALQQKLISTENRYHTLFENVIDPILIIDLRSGKIVDCNIAAVSFYGILDKSYISDINESHALVRYNTKKKESLTSVIIKAYEQGRAEYQVEFLNHKNQELILDCSLSIDKTEEKNHKGILYIKDVTEQVQAFGKVSKERELLHAVIEGTPDKIIVEDMDRKVIAINSNFVNYFQKTIGQKVEIGTDMKSIYGVVNDKNYEKRKIWNKKVDSVLNGATIEHQYDRKIDGKTVHYSISASPLRGESNDIKGIIGTSRDISELIKKSDEIEEKNIELQKYLDSNIQLENFAYIASHDLKQPLRTIISFSELLHSKKADQLDEDANKYINFILDSSQRLNALISDMLAYSVIGTAGQKEVLDPSLIIDHVLDDLSAQINQSSAKVIIGKLPSTIKVFKSEFISLIQNLVSNSIKYSKDDVNPLIEIAAVEKSDNWKFSLRDNGMGIKEVHLERIFGMFQRLDVNQDTTGTGIGLAHCKKILELHEGEIWAESELGKGTTFNFTLPK